MLGRSAYMRALNAVIMWSFIVLHKPRSDYSYYHRHFAFHLTSKSRRLKHSDTAAASC